MFILQFSTRWKWKETCAISVQIAPRKDHNRIGSFSLSQCEKSSGNILMNVFCVLVKISWCQMGWNDVRPSKWCQKAHFCVNLTCFLFTLSQSIPENGVSSSSVSPSHTNSSPATPQSSGQLNPVSPEEVRQWFIKNQRVDSHHWNVDSAILIKWTVKIQKNV